MIEHAKTRTVGYVRRSTDRQEQSIDDQKKALKLYAAENGLQFLKFYIDDAISGTSTIGRRAFQQMVEDAQSQIRPFDIIVVYDVKRFGRVDNDEAGYYRHILRTHGVEVNYVSENFTGDTTDDLLRPVKQWQARQESKDLSKVTIRGLLSKSETGCWMGGVPPYGYDLKYESYDGNFLFIVRYLANGTKQLLDEKGCVTRSLGKGESLSISRKDHARLFPGLTERVDVVDNIFNMYVNHGKGFKAISHTLNAAGCPTARNSQWSPIYSGQWNDTTVRSILVNPVYAGDMVWNRRTDAKFHRISQGRAIDYSNLCGARMVPNAKEDWIIVRDAHPALIDRLLFEQAQTKLQQKIQSIEQRGKNPRLKTHGKTWEGKRCRFILSGLMKCVLCGSRYQGLKRSKGKKRFDGTRSIQTFYGCGGHISKGNTICKMNPLPQEELESLVVNTVLDYYSPYLEKDGRKKISALIKDQSGVEQENIEKSQQRAREELERISGIINNLLDNLTKANREYVDKRLTELNAQRKKLEERLRELDLLALSQVEIRTTVADTLKFISGLEYTLTQGLPQEKIVALRQCIERIWMNVPGKTIKIQMNTLPNCSAITATDEIAVMLNTGS
jgi:DNA invertase Pin-like site-specific DNA recombinase